MRRMTWLVVAAALVAGSSLAAITKNSKLYVRTRNTRLMDRPNGKTVATLQPGQEVIWLGTVSGQAGWHQVQVGKKKGALLTANLSTKPPSREILATDGTKTIDQATFLSSAAATKALAPAAIQYGEQREDMKAAVREVQAMERLSDAVTPKLLSEHVEASGLVGSSLGGTAGGAR